MNAKKIMGAVLVALLAAALFVGAGAAAGIDDFNGKTVFVYQEIPELAGTSWNNGANSITFDANGVVSGKTIVEGAYVNGDNTIYVKYPTAAISAIADNKTVKYPVIGGNFYKGTEWLNLTIASPAGAMIDNLLITLPNGTQMKAWDVIGIQYATAWPNGILTATSPVTSMANGTVKLALNETVQNLIFTQTGTYKIQAIFNVSGAEVGVPGMSGTTEYPLVAYIPDEYLVAKDVYTVTFVDDEEQEVTLSASVDKVLAGKTFTVTITGMPGKTYTLDAKENADLTIISAAGANTINTSSGEFTIPNGGSITVYVKSSEEDEITLVVDDAEVTIEIIEPTLTVTLGAPSYFIGDDIEVILSSDSELGSTYYFNITGTNIDKTPLSGDAPEDKDGKLTYELPTKGKKFDVGTYTIIVNDGSKDVATLPVALKQPFISIADAPEVIVQNKSATFLINAEAATGVQAYIFGTNKFIPVFNGTSLVKVEQDADKKDIPNLFNITLPATETKNMSTGQYFAVFQHPMYDGKFNINATTAGAFWLNATATANGEGQLLFNASERQTANAAQALCDALDSQNIDDMYVKASFFVVSTADKDTFSISEIPTTVAQGETVTITGVATEYDGQTVTVEMVSTAFAAVPKETVGSAAFILATTKIAEDGTWEITLDTTGLNIDEYNLAVKIAEDVKESVTVNVVEAADEPVNPEQPEQPENPENPTEPEAPATPGFGALAALAGLGAVAVLLLRRE